MKQHTVEYQTPIRLDRFLKHQYPLLTQGIIQQALRKSLVKVEDKTVKDASLRLTYGQTVKVADFFAQYSKQEKTNFSQSLQILANKILHEYLIFENEQFIVINKPEKIASQGGTGIKISVADGLLLLNQQQNRALRIVHRLDKATSGLMLIAKHYDAAVKLTQAFSQRKIYKTYQAILLGKLQTASGTIKLADEITKFKLLKYLPNCDLSYVEFYPITGKEHQIRRHALELGSSILGDKRYGPESKAEHMFLHAIEIEIDEEVFGEKFRFTAELPDYFLQKL